jgi:hypothetical protein
VKSGRLLKFHRPGGDVHAYLYRDGPVVRAALYVMSPAREGDSEPQHVISGPSEEQVEAEVRAWIEARFPRRA